MNDPHLLLLVALADPYCRAHLRLLAIPVYARYVSANLGIDFMIQKSQSREVARPGEFCTEWALPDGRLHRTERDPARDYVPLPARIYRNHPTLGDRMEWYFYGALGGPWNWMYDLPAVVGLVPGAGVELKWYDPPGTLNRTGGPRPTRPTVLRAWPTPERGILEGERQWHFNGHRTFKYWQGQDEHSRPR